MIPPLYRARERLDKPGRDSRPELIADALRRRRIAGVEAARVRRDTGGKKTVSWIGVSPIAATPVFGSWRYLFDATTEKYEYKYVDDDPSKPQIPWFTGALDWQRNAYINAVGSLNTANYDMPAGTHSESNYDITYLIELLDKAGTVLKRATIENIGQTSFDPGVSNYTYKEFAPTFDAGLGNPGSIDEFWGVHWKVNSVSHSESGTGNVLGDLYVIDVFMTLVHGGVIG